MLDTYPLLEKISFPEISRGELNTLQLNLGYLCNLQCKHCHVNAGPQRKELMSLETINEVIEFVQNHSIKTIDITGGAPEMHPDFSYLIKSLSELNCHIIVRTNLVILDEAEYSGLIDLFVQHRVNLVASLPCYLEQNVDQQRGKGVYTRSIKVLQKLNARGYGIDKQLPLSLMYNPQGAFLPPQQQQLETQYKQYLQQQYNISFHHLLTLTNQPISRFGSQLLSLGQFDDYMQLLQESYNSQNLSSVMCKELISIDWQGIVYDCDFNQMLGLSLGMTEQHIKDYQPQINRQIPIRVAGHCYACTAGTGSSCSGALN